MNVIEGGDVAVDVCFAVRHSAAIIIHTFFIYWRGASCRHPVLDVAVMLNISFD